MESKFSIASVARSRWTFFGLFILIFLLTHLRQNAINNYGCEVCADKAGYYVYLPATFNYGFHATDFPPKADVAQGNGFHLDTVSNKVVTKFTSGVAIMQAPFYLIARSTASGETSGPFSRHYLLFINIGLAFYITMGLYFLTQWYATQTDLRTGFLTGLFIFFGTHLYYYVLDEGLMSHAYSFVLLCASLFFSQRFWIDHRIQNFLGLAIAVSLAILIRPTNFLFVPIVFFIGADSVSEIKARFKAMMAPTKIVLGGAIFIVIFLPQMLYWKFVYGSYIAWSYTGEGFTNWNDPHFAEVLFSPQSGLFPYTPILLLTIIASFFYWKSHKNARIVIGVFIAVTYLCASWSNYNFGECNFGKRPFVEYLPVLMLSVLWMVYSMKNRSAVTRWSVRSVLTAAILYNIWLFGAFDTCFGGTQWDWSKFGELLSKGTFLP